MVIIMVSVINRPKGNQSYYYLNYHSGNIQREKYLGKLIPKNIEELKKQFMYEIHCKEWDKKIKVICKNYQKESKELTETIKLKNFESFGIAFTYNTQRIEGSTLTESNTKDLLVFKMTPPRKQQADVIETQKHYDLFMKLFTIKPTKITKDIILRWHKEIFGQTKIGEAGNIRQHRVGVTTNDKIDFTPVAQIRKDLVNFFKWVNSYKKGQNPVEFACLAHYRFVSIHPFADGNGRISRLMMNYILHKYYCPLLIIKNSDRRAYFKSLEKSQLRKDDIYFRKWFMKYYIKANRKYLK